MSPSRPGFRRLLALSGLAAVGGVEVAERLAPAPAGLAALASLGLLWIGWRGWAVLAGNRRANPLGATSGGVWAVILLAAVAGYSAGRTLVRRVAHVEAVQRKWPRGPPRVARCELVVGRCQGVPFRDRAWLEGRTTDGIGVFCAWPGSLPNWLAPGARAVVTGRFYVPAGPTNPGETDRRLALARRGVAFRAQLRTPRNVERVLAAPTGPRLWLYRARQAAARRLYRDLPPDIAPLASALLLGLRSGVTDADRLSFERTGTLHMLAISGMHLVLLAGCLHLLLRSLGAGPRAAALTTLLFAAAYVPIAGAGPPIRRAALMVALYGLSLVRGRPPDVWNALGAAALLLALFDPADVARLGFRLSFLAAGGIAWLASGWRDAWSERHRFLARFPAVRRDRRVRLFVMRYWYAAFPVGLAASCATQGVVAYEFGAVTPLAPLINVAVGPLVALALPIVGLAALGIPGVAPIASWALASLRDLLSAASHLPGTYVFLPIFPLFAVWIWLAATGALRLYPRWALPALVGSAALVGVHVSSAASEAPAELVALDVGHGQAILLRTGTGRDVLVDAGSRSRQGVGRRSILPALRALGVVRLRAVVCTHADTDHWNAIPDVLARVPVAELWIGTDPPAALLASAHRFGVPVRRAVSDLDLIRGNGVRIQILAPAPDLAGESRNNRSLVVLYRAGTFAAVLPADRETIGTRALVAHLQQIDSAAAVLVAPHHGGRNAAAAALGRAVRPRILVVSTGPRSAHASTLAGYGARRIVRTDRHGCLRLRAGPGNEIAVRPFRRARDTLRPP